MTGLCRTYYGRHRTPLAVFSRRLLAAGLYVAAVTSVAAAALVLSNMLGTPRLGVAFVLGLSGIALGWAAWWLEPLREVTP